MGSVESFVVDGPSDFRAAGFVARELMRRPGPVAASSEGVYSGFASVSDEVRVPLDVASRHRLSALLRQFMASRRSRFAAWPEAMPSAAVDGDDLVFWVALPVDEARGKRYAGTGFVREF